MGRYDLHEDEAPVYNMNITGAEFPPITVDAAARIRSELSSRKTEYVQECIKMQKDRETAAERVEEGKAFVTELLASAPEERMDFYRDLFPPNASYTVSGSMLQNNPGRESTPDEFLGSLLDISLSKELDHDAATVIGRNTYGHFIVDEPIDISRLPLWLVKSTRTLEFKGFLVSELAHEQFRDYALHFPNAQRIIAGTYVVDLHLARQSAPEVSKNDNQAMVESHMAMRVENGRPLVMQSHRGTGLETIPQPAQYVSPQTWPEDRSAPTVEIVVYFVDTKTPSNEYRAGIVAIYDTLANTVTSAEPCFFYRNSTSEMPVDKDGTDMDNHWGNPQSWLQLKDEQEVEAKLKDDDTEEMRDVWADAVAAGLIS